MREGFPKKGILSFYWNPSLNIIRFSKREFRFPLLSAQCPLGWGCKCKRLANLRKRLFLLKPLRVSVNHPAELLHGKDFEIQKIKLEEGLHLNYIIECVVV